MCEGFGLCLAVNFNCNIECKEPDIFRDRSEMLTSVGHFVDNADFGVDVFIQRILCKSIRKILPQKDLNAAFTPKQG